MTQDELTERQKMVRLIMETSILFDAPPADLHVMMYQRALDATSPAGRAFVSLVQIARADPDKALSTIDTLGYPQVRTCH